MFRFSILLVVLSISAVAAQDAFIVSDNARRPILPWSRSPAQPQARVQATSARHHWAAFESVPNEAARKTMASLGVEVMGFAGRSGPYQLYKVRTAGDPVRAFEALKRLAGFVNLLPVLPEEKMNARVIRREFRRGAMRGGKAKATVLFHRPHTLAEATKLLADKVDQVIPDAAPYLFHVIAAPDRILALADLDEVARVEDFLEWLPTNDRSRELTLVNALQAPVLDTVSFPPTAAWNAGAAFTGDSIWVAINEGVDKKHLDFRENAPSGSVFRSALPADTASAGTLHGSHVAGIVAGNGWNSEFDPNGGGRYQRRGVAPKARFISAWDGGDANNHSHITNTAGYYGHLDASYDDVISDHSGERWEAANVSVWAAGNNGGYYPQYGEQKGYYSMLVNAKNSIKVGSVDPDGRRSAFSSMGPTRDGRIGPDLMAPGGVVFSVLNNSQEYVAMGGTSMASPQVTGIVALLLQKYRDTVLRRRGAGANVHDHSLWNSTLKAILVHTARDMIDLAGVSYTDADFEAGGFPFRSPLFAAGPDFATGYGLVDAQRATRFVDTTLFLEAGVNPGQTLSYAISVPAGQGNLRVTLAWDDPPFLGANDGTGAYLAKLVNDLDLRLVSPTGVAFQPWILDHSSFHDGIVPVDGLDPVTPADVLDHPAGKGRDSLNNLEVVDVANPAAGTWRIEVRGFAIPVDQSLNPGVNQDFSLVSDFALPAAAAASGPDLAISKVTWTPSRPTPGEEVRFRATMVNLGNQASPAGVVHSLGISRWGSRTDSVLTHSQSLAPGQSVVLDATAPVILGPGPQQISAMTDYRGAITETSERNNRFSGLLAIPSLPSSWEAQEIGILDSPGWHDYRGLGAFYMQAGGGNIGAGADACHFVHRSLAGDGEIKARIFFFAAGSGPAAEAGVMIRESLEPGSKQAFMSLTSGNGAFFKRRETSGGATQSVASAGLPPSWVRLVRSGATFTGYTSPDGIIWSQVGAASITMGAQTRVGLAFASYEAGATSFVEFESVALAGGVLTGINGRVSDRISDGDLAGVTVTLSGGAAGTVLTDASGSFAFNGLSAGKSYTLTASHSAYAFSPASQTIASLNMGSCVDFLGTPSAGPLPSPWVTADIGAAGVPGTASHASGTFTVEGSGADIFGTADAFRFVHRPLSGNGEIRARVHSVENTDPWAKVGVMMREGLAANARNVFMAITSTQGATFQQRTAPGATTAYARLTGFAAPYWVRLTRTGNVFTGYRSADGINWTQQAQATLAVGANLSVGLAVTSHNNTALATGVFSDVALVSGAPAFQEADIGSVGFAGSRTESGGMHTIRGSGADIWGTSDAFHFSHLGMTGDGEIKARVTAVQNTHSSAKAGVMIRESLAAGSRHLMVVATPASGILFERRRTTGGSSINTSAAGLAAPYWVRLVRVGNVFTASRSADGVAWTQMGQETLALPATVQVGLAVTSHNNAVLGSGTFTNVKVP